MNPYGYAAGDPINSHDPFGLSCLPFMSKAECDAIDQAIGRLERLQGVGRAVCRELGRSARARFNNPSPDVGFLLGDGIKLGEGALMFAVWDTASKAFKDQHIYVNRAGFNTSPAGQTEQIAHEEYHLTRNTTHATNAESRWDETDAIGALCRPRER